MSVASNACLFKDDAGWLPLPGDWASSSETFVSEGVPSHIDKNTYLLWFERDLTPHVEYTKPPGKEAIAHAYFAVGGQGVAIRDGRLGSVSTNADRRTIIGVSILERKLWLATFENASSQVAAQTLADRGAMDAIMLDGGTSSCMTLGWQAKNVRPGTVLGGWRPVATTFGIRARPLP